MLIKTICRGLLDAVYPPLCLLCGCFSCGRYPHCCQECLDSFEAIGPSCCALCGEPFGSGQAPHLCLTCITKKRPFRWCRGVYLYQGEIAEALMQFKYRGRISLQGPLEETLVRGVENFNSLPEADMLVPVPMSRGGLWKRGFNQSFLLGSHLAKHLGLPVKAQVLTRRGNHRQVGLSAARRAMNASRSFMPGPDINRVMGRHVLLFDDVYTTGATARACARILQKGGARVSVLTFARAVSPYVRRA